MIVHTTASGLEHNGARLLFEEGVYRWKQHRIELTRREVAVLALLMRSAGSPVSAETITHRIFEGRGGNSPCVYINYLRTKGVPCITTLRSRGYQYCGFCEECKA